MQIIRAVDAPYLLNAILTFLFSQLVTIPVMVGGVLLIDRDSMGLHWIAPAFVGAFVLAISDSWVVLVEIRR